MTAVQLQFRLTLPTLTLDAPVALRKPATSSGPVGHVVEVTRAILYRLTLKPTDINVVITGTTDRRARTR